MYIYTLCAYMYMDISYACTSFPMNASLLLSNIVCICVITAISGNVGIATTLPRRPVDDADEDEDVVADDTDDDDDPTPLAASLSSSASEGPVVLNPIASAICFSTLMYLYV